MKNEHFFNLPRVCNNCFNPADSKADAIANWGNLDTVSYIEEDEYKIQFQSSGDTTMEVTDVTEPYIDIIE